MQRNMLAQTSIAGNFSRDKTLAGIWPLIDFATQLIVVDQSYVQEVEIKVLNCKKSTLEKCSQCTEIVEKYTVIIQW